MPHKQIVWCVLYFSLTMDLLLWTSNWCWLQYVCHDVTFMSHIVNKVFCWQQLIHPGEIILKSRHKEIGLVVFHWHNPPGLIFMLYKCTYNQIYEKIETLSLFCLVVQTNMYCTVTTTIYVRIYSWITTCILALAQVTMANGQYDKH